MSALGLGNGKAPAKIAQLEARIAQLEARRSADAVQPTLLSVNPDGTIGAAFTGVVRALGLSLPTGTTTPIQRSNEIVWTRLDGSVSAEIDALAAAGLNNLELISLARSFEIAQVVVSAQRGASGPSVLLLDSGGKSNFLQLLSAQKQNVQLGYAAAVDSDGGGWCNYALPAAFPAACDGVIAQNGFGGTSGDALADVQPVDAGHFRAFINGAGLNADAYFIAWGH